MYAPRTGDPLHGRLQLITCFDEAQFGTTIVCGLSSAPRGVFFNVIELSGVALPGIHKSREQSRERAHENTTAHR